MAVNGKINSITYPAGASFSTEQHRIVGIASDGQIDSLEDATTMPLGVILNKPSAAGQGAEVAVVGSDVKVEAGESINEGDLVKATTGGRAAAILGGTAAGTAYVVGVCTQAASGSGALAGVLINPFKYITA